MSMLDCEACDAWVREGGKSGLKIQWGMSQATTSIMHQPTGQSCAGMDEAGPLILDCLVPVGEGRARGIADAGERGPVDDG